MRNDREEEGILREEGGEMKEEIGKKRGRGMGNKDRDWEKVEEEGKVGIRQRAGSTVAVMGGCSALYRSGNSPVACAV